MIARCKISVFRDNNLNFLELFTLMVLYLNETRKIETMKLVAYAFIGLLALSCGTKKNANQEEVSTDKNETMPTTMDIVKVTAEIDNMEKDYISDPITIDAVEIRMNIMYIDVTYSGGCEKHDFRVIGSSMIAKSMPPIRSVKLVHKANGDTCREIKKVKLEVYIDDLAYQKEAGSEIFLNVAHWKERLLYTYK